jgi:hypothetical protein
MPVLLLLAGVCVVHLSACGKQSANIPATSKPNQLIESTERKEPFAFDVSSWQAEWDLEKQSSSLKYQGKLIELTGEVWWTTANDVSITAGSGGQVFLQGIGDARVSCITIDPQPWLTATTGSTVTVRGYCNRRWGNQLEDCVILKASANPLIVTTASELANSVVSDPLKAVEKYNKKWLITGEVKGTRPGKYGSVYLVLTGTAGKDVTAFVGPVSLEKNFKKIVIGQKLTLYCQIYDVNDPDDGISLHKTLLSNPSK